MTLPTSGPLSINDIAGEFGGTAPHSMNEYYAGGGLVPAGTSGTYGAVPSSGQISIQNFYGTASQYVISRSVRQQQVSPSYFTRTFGTPTNRKIYTLSLWVKIKGTSTGRFFAACTSGSDDAYAGFISSGQLFIGSYRGAGTDYSHRTVGLFRDPTAWYHVVIAVDTTQATDTNRVKIYVNGVQQTTTNAGNGYWPQNYESLFNSATVHNTGPRPGFLDNPFDGYLADYYFIDGQQLTPSSFGQTNADTGAWEPISYSGSYGNNGFYMNFSDNSGVTSTTLGKDYSGNGNNWTPVSMTVSGSDTDSFVDSPTNSGTDTGAGGEVRGNYCTWNGVQATTAGTLSRGNLVVTTSTTNANVGTFAMTSGKWYWEIEITTQSNPRIGLYNLIANPAGLGENVYSVCLLNNPSRIYYNGATTNYGSFVPVNGVIVNVAYDADTGKLWFGQNGSWFSSGNPATGANPSWTFTGTSVVPAFSSGGGTNEARINTGQRPFSYTAPSGFKALCTENLPTPAVLDGSDYFNTVIYTGTGDSLNRSITGVGFQPDMVWQKRRSTVANHFLYDVIRGVGSNKDLVPNRAEGQGGTNGTAQYGYLSSFDADGFSTTKGSVNNDIWNSVYNFVAWNWKANGAGVSNTAGTITSTVSANTTAGFSIVKWTGTGASGTTGHGLGVAPKMIILKDASNAYNWYVFTTATGSNLRFEGLNTTAAASSQPSQFTTTATLIENIPGTASFNTSGANMIAYCFAPIAGYSAFGSYTGNGSSDGPFVYTGFRPSWIMFRSVASGADWCIFDIKRDSYNVSRARLDANNAFAETNADYFDFVSNGFKLRTTNGNFNSSGNTYIYAAFAENSFKYSRAR